MVSAAQCEATAEAAVTLHHPMQMANHFPKEDEPTNDIIIIIIIIIIHVYMPTTLSMWKVPSECLWIFVGLSSSIVCTVQGKRKRKQNHE